MDATGVITAVPHKARPLSQYEKWSITAFLIISLITFAALLIRSELRASVHWQYWTQVLTGNWSPLQPQDTMTLPGQTKEPYISDTEYTIGVIFALVLNIAPFALIVGAIRAFLKRSANMKLVEAFASREVTIEGSVIRAIECLVPPEQQLHVVQEMKKAIAEARKNWWGPLLNERFGLEEAAKLRKRMSEMEISP